MAGSKVIIEDPFIEFARSNSHCSCGSVNLLNLFQGEVNVTHDNLNEFLAVAEELQVS